MAIINLSGTINSSFTTSGVLVNATQSAGDAIFTIDLRPANPIALVQDNLDYGVLGWNIDDVVAIVSVIGPQGQIYVNEDYGSPDIEPSTSRYLNKTITLPLDPLTDYTNILKGNYTLKISWYNSVLDEYYAFLDVYQYNIDPATIANTTVSGPYTGVLKSTDTTEYGNNVHQIIREHRIQYPTQLAVPPLDVVSSNAEIQVTPIYTNQWTIIINSFVEYRMPDTLRIYWEGTGTFTHCVYGGCIGAMYDAIETMLATYTDAMACNLNNQEDYQKRLVIVNSAWHLLNEAYWTGDAEEADEQAYIIQEQVAYTGSGTCGGPSSELVVPCPPWTGGGPGGAYTFSNALTEAASEVVWGGTLVQATTINMIGYEVLFSGSDAGNSVSQSISAAGGILQKAGDGATEGRVYVTDSLITLELADIGTPANTRGYEIGLGGLVEKADYTAGYVDRSLVAKDYVDGLFASAPTYTFQNGLTEAAGVVSWGGTLVDVTTTVNAGENNLLIQANHVGNDVSTRIMQNSSFVSQRAFAAADYSVTNGYSMVHFEEDTLILQVQDSGNQDVRLDMSPGYIGFTDETNSKGVVYAADYSTVGITDDRWIPDYGAVKAYADSVGGAVLFTSLTDTPNDYVGFGGYFVRVNTGATALEFVVSAWVPVTGGTFTGQVTIATSTDRPLILQQIGAGSTPGTPEGGWNLLSFQDNDGDEQGYVGIDAAGNVVLSSWVTGAGILIDSDLEVNGDIIVTGVVDGVDIAAWKTSYDIKEVNWDLAYGWGDHAGLYQPLDADLTSIAGLGFTADAFLKKSAAETWYLDTEIYASLTYVNSLALTYVYVPDSTTVTTSDGYTGTNDDVILLDGSYMQIEEATGIPGYEVRFEFIDVIAFNNVFLYIYYNGGGGHSIDIELYNYDTLGWDKIGEFTDHTAFTIIDIIIPLHDDYISAGDVSTMRFYHTDTGINTHFLQMDYICLRHTAQLGGGGSVSDHGGLTGLADDDHPQYALADGTRCTYYIPSGAKYSSVDAGTFGETSMDDDYIYVCTQTGTATNALWKKVAISQSP